MTIFTNILSKQTPPITPAKHCPKKTIIFDLGDVVFKTSKGKQASAILPSTLLNPTIIYTMLTTNIRKELFETLAQLSSTQGDEVNIMYNQGKPLPQIWSEWMMGQHQSETLYSNAIVYINQTSYSSNKKKILQKIIQTVFSPQKLVASQKPIKNMVKLIKGLKNHGYKLYVLSNWDKESFPLLEKKHSDIFKLFDGIMISGNEGIGKPNPKVYTKLLEQYNLKTSECIFIDDEPYNIKTAQNLGISSILKTSMNEVYKELQKLGVIHTQ